MEGPNGADEREMCLYLTQIQYLDKKLEGCQLRCDELKKHNVSLIAQCKALEEDRRDISEFLKHDRITKERKADELAEALEAQQQDADQDLKDLKRQQSLQTEELREQVDMLTSQIRRQAAQIEEQKEQKEWFRLQLCDLKPLEEKLLREKEEQEATLRRLTSEEQKEMSRLVKETEKALREWCERKSSEIIEEERALHAEQMQQLHVILDEIETLREERDDLQGDAGALSGEVDDVKEDAARVEKDISNNETAAEQLTDVCRRLQAELDEYGVMEEGVLQEVEELRAYVASASEERRQKAATAVELEAELQSERRRGEQLERDVKEAVIILRHVVKDSKQASHTQLCLQLQEVLEGNSALLTDSALRDSIETRSGGRKRQSADPGPARTESLNMATDPLFLLARYRPGDLGLVPRPSWNL